MRSVFGATAAAPNYNSLVHQTQNLKKAVDMDETFVLPVLFLVYLTGGADKDMNAKLAQFDRLSRMLMPYRIA